MPEEREKPQFAPVDASGGFPTVQMSDDGQHGVAGHEAADLLSQLVDLLAAAEGGLGGEGPGDDSTGDFGIE